MRSVRNGKKVRQETVAYLGELDAKGRAKASAVAKHFLGKRNDQLDLFEDRSSLDSVPVNLKKVRVERGRVFERELLERSGWEEVRDGLEVKLCRGPHELEAFILCRSADRQEKEKAMHERFAKRIVTGPGAPRTSSPAGEESR